MALLVVAVVGFGATRTSWARRRSAWTPNQDLARRGCARPHEAADLLQRLARIDQHVTAGRVRVDGELVDDLDQPAPEPARVVLWAP